MKSYARAGVMLIAALLPALEVAAQQQVPRTLTLEQAVGLALQANRDLQDARLGLDAAQGQVREAWGSVMPTLDATASYTRNLSVPANFLPRIIFDPSASPDELVPVKFGADNTWSFMLRAEQPLFQASAFLGVGAADRYERLQTESVRGVATAVAARVRVGYYDVLLAQEGVRLSENTVRRIRQSLEETQAMQRAGVASDYDVLRLQVELANVEPNLRRARDAAAAARRALAIEIGLANLDSVAVAGALAEFDFSRPIAANAPALHLASLRESDGVMGDDEQAIAAALVNRSDVRQAELMERLRHTEVRVEQSEYLPKVSLFANYSVNAQHNGDIEFFGGDDQFRSYGRQVGLQVTMPVFSGFKRPARLEQKRAVLEQARTQQQLLRDQVEHQVRTLLAQVREAEERGAAQQLARQQATRGYEIARAQYREGISSPLELTDAEVALRQSEFNYAQAVYDYLAARARLDEALGVTPSVDRDGAVALTLETSGQ
jgi:outer membrane protein TolC